MELTYLIEAAPNICMNLWVGMLERALVTPMYQHILGISQHALGYHQQKL